MDVVPDSVLVARIAAGDDDALAEIYRRYGGLVFGVARRATGSAAMAADVVQEVFCGLWRHPQHFDSGRGSLRVYLGFAAQRKACDAMRREARRLAREQRYGNFEVEHNRQVQADDDGCADEAVRQAISRLPDDQRLVVEMAFWEGRTHVEIAAALSLPEGTVKSRLRLARAKLTRSLADLVVETA